MKVTNTWPFDSLGAELEDLVVKMRARFPSPEEFVTLKADRLNAYMQATRRDTVVVAVSGGIDSGLVLALCVFAQKRTGSPIKRIVGVTLPVSSKAATNQDKSVARAKDLCASFGVECRTIELKDVHSVLNESVCASLGEGDDWSFGQLASYIRTPALYQVTSVLTTQGHAPLVVGTTNKDEGAYIGYFGKASDGMVDVQLISDMSKFFVRACAKALGVGQDILSVSPSGDMYDGRLDEEVFGAPYEFVELDAELRYQGEVFSQDIISGLSASARDRFEAFRANIENMHRYNGHKYLGASPAVHLDVVDVQFEGGWHYRVFKGQAYAAPTQGDHRRW